MAYYRVEIKAPKKIKSFRTRERKDCHVTVLIDGNEEDYMAVALRIKNALLIERRHREISCEITKTLM